MYLLLCFIVQNISQKIFKYIQSYEVTQHFGALAYAY